MYGSGARAIKFTEKYFLPGPQQKVTFFNKDCQGAAHEGGHDMGSRVSFQVLIRKMHGHDFLQSGNNVIFNCGITPFVDGQARSGMRIEKRADARVSSGRNYLL